MRYLFSILVSVIILFIPQYVENNPLEVYPDFEEVDKFVEYQQNVNEYIDFKEKVGFRESGGNYEAIKWTGTYWGKYQFGKIAREEVKIDKGMVAFLSDSLTQEMAFYDLLCTNKEYLSDEIDQYEGWYINDTRISKSGILASAHLVGYYSVKLYLDSDGNFVRSDGNGTSLESYMKDFGGYDFNLGCEDNNGIKKHIVENYGR